MLLPALPMADDEARRRSNLEILKPDMPRSPEEEQRMISALTEEHEREHGPFGALKGNSMNLSEDAKRAAREAGARVQQTQPMKNVPESELGTGIAGTPQSTPGYPGYTPSDINRPAPDNPQPMQTAPDAPKAEAVAPDTQPATPATPATAETAAVQSPKQEAPAPVAPNDDSKQEARAATAAANQTNQAQAAKIAAQSDSKDATQPASEPSTPDTSKPSITPTTPEN